MAELQDVLAKVNDIVKKISANKTLIANFKKNPVKLLEQKFGIDLPDEQINKVIDAIKAKLIANQVAGFIDDVSDDKPADILGKIGNLLGKK